MKPAVGANGLHPLLGLRRQRWKLSIRWIDDHRGSNGRADPRESASPIKKQLVICTVDVRVSTPIAAVSIVLFQIILLVSCSFRFRDGLLPLEFMEALQGRERGVGPDTLQIGMAVRQVGNCL